ncbi:MAG: RND family efflux transporter MFP subunit [Planctomycetota bacterium]|jgi:RND family efflux transporter MFP subunit
MASQHRKFWIIPPIVVAILIFYFMAAGRDQPDTVDRGETVRFVRVIEAVKRDVTPSIEGYGSVTPARTWKAIAQVSGRVVYMHPRLRDGEIITAGTELLRIDPIDYELALAQAENELAELKIEASNAGASLNIEQSNLNLAEDEFKRRQQLAKQGTLSKSSADEAERAMLNSRSLVQNLKNTIAIIPTRQNLLALKITQANRDLANTRIAAPFNMRVSGLATEIHQYTGAGQVMFSGDSTDRVEVIAQVSIADLRKLFIGHAKLPDDINVLTNNLVAITGFKPVLRLDLGGGQVAQWQAEFVRMSDRVDAQTRTMGIVVAVDNPLQKIIVGVRPPLSKGMFVQVSIAGRVQPGQIIIPRSALRGNKIYRVNAQSRLEIGTVERLYNQDGFSIIKSGIDDGDKIVVTDLLPAVAGMLLATEVDNQLQQSLGAVN